MDRREIQERARFLYTDELQYALAREQENFNTDAPREKATMRLTREMEGQEIYELCRATIESISRNVERQFVVDVTEGQLRLEGAIRTGNNILISMRNARLEDWLAFDEMRESKFRDHEAKRDIERSFVRDVIVPRLQAAGEDKTTFEACPDLFVNEEAVAS